MLNYPNPYDVLSETISFENVQLMSEMITLKTLRGRYAYARRSLEWLYVGLVKDLNRATTRLVGRVYTHFPDAFMKKRLCVKCWGGDKKKKLK